MRKRLTMTAWYNPALLVQTGIRVVVSTVFGEMADRREAIAAANAIADQPFDPSFDYSARKDPDGSFWFDFLADTGDGWDSTFAMAQLVTEPMLRPEGAQAALPRGRILMLGGDEVYPTASREAYDDRFLYPFEEAYEGAVAAAGGAGEMPDLYVVPGNHDWYDGLSAFFGLFCRRRIATPGTVGVSRPGRQIAGRPTWQTRTYFALKLPGGWWLWGTDSQIKGYIDQPQIDFFQYVASQWMEDESKLILCAGMPNWAYVDEDRPEKEFETFSYLERLAGIARVPLTAEDERAGRTIADQPLKGHKLKLVLTGDSHHYSRYCEPRGHPDDVVQYVTCGGGGAFLHPTHQLRDKNFTWDYPPPGEAGGYQERGHPRRFEIARKANGEKALFPDAAVSRRLTAGNSGFAVRNIGMTLVFIGAYLFYNWLLNANARLDGHFSLPQALALGPSWQAPLRYVWLGFVSPWPLLLFCAAMGGYYYFADSPWDSARRFRMGVLGHGLPQAALAIVLTSLLLWSAGRLLGGRPVNGLWPHVEIGVAILFASVIAGIAAATLFGLYLWRQLNRYGRHWNEAFSALAIADYKCFLRLCIRRDGKLELYPIGLTGTPTDGASPTNRIHLIEGPVEIG